jgi:phage tail-like protein
MPVERDNPYGSFNFLVDLGTGDSTSVKAGFQEVTGLNIEVTSTEYRNGNDKVNYVRKIDSVYKVGDITLRRGLMGALDLFQWIDQVRKGDQTARKSVTIQLRDESGANTVMTWKLANARPIRYNGPALNAKTGSDVAIEELVLSCEDLAIE